MKFKILTAITAATLMGSCGKVEKPAETTTTQVETPAPAASTPEVTNEERVEKAMRLNRRGEYISSFHMEGDKVEIKYETDYATFTQNNPNAKVQEADMKNVWATKNDVLQTLVDGPMRMMRKFDFVNDVKITVPYEGKTYDIHVTKPAVESYLNAKFEDIKKDFDKMFFKKYVLEPKGQETFFNQFGSVK